MRAPFIAVIAAVSTGFFFAACSSSSSTPSGGGSGGGDGGASSGDSGGTSACSCDISNNGVLGTVQCGQSGCVNGSTFTCDSSANSTKGGSCTTGGDSGASSGCSLFTCNASADCGGVAPCFSTSTAGTNYCYEQEGDPSQCSSGTTATTKTTSNGPTTICVPSTCPQPVNFLP